jgi:hypothetical protein
MSVGLTCIHHLSVSFAPLSNIQEACCFRIRYDFILRRRFFWPVELGIGKVNIKNLVIRYFPKILDYEPVKVTNSRDRIVVMSRFHYHIITYFNKPLMKMANQL